MKNCRGAGAGEKRKNKSSSAKTEKVVNRRVRRRKPQRELMSKRQSEEREEMIHHDVRRCAEVVQRGFTPSSHFLSCFFYSSLKKKERKKQSRTAHTHTHMRMLALLLQCIRERERAEVEPQIIRARRIPGISASEERGLKESGELKRILTLSTPGVASALYDAMLGHKAGQLLHQLCSARQEEAGPKVKV